MKPTVNTKFYTFNQNNSGGSFHVDEKRGIAEYVIIEALSPDDANRRAEEIGVYFGGVESGMDCPCCGDRWSSIWHEEKGDDEPSVYGKALSEHRVNKDKWISGRIPIHYLDGKIEWQEI